MIIPILQVVMIIKIKILLMITIVKNTYDYRNTCRRIVCRRLVYLDCNCEGGELLLGRWQPPDHDRHHFHHHFKSSSSSCFMQLRLLYQFFFITCLPSTVRPRVLCINLLKVKGDKQLCQAQCASPLVQLFFVCFWALFDFFFCCC